MGGTAVMAGKNVEKRNTRMKEIVMNLVSSVKEIIK